MISESEHKPENHHEKAENPLFKLIYNTSADYFRSSVRAPLKGEPRSLTHFSSLLRVFNVDWNQEW